MYAIVQSGGHQYRVTEGQTVEVERLEADAGSSIELGEVLLVSGDEVSIGRPFVEGAKVRATVLGEEKGRKIVVFKYKPKNRYRKKTGHRQPYTRLRIDAIEV